ncbi:hypothetical protein HMI55_001638 [Coelomomyces lativittatus]|nr:hypothetical protein HMI55_001638 [Coelomomyces lativittatus]
MHDDENHPSSLQFTIKKSFFFLESQCFHLSGFTKVFIYFFIYFFFLKFPLDTLIFLSFFFFTFDCNFFFCLERFYFFPLHYERKGGNAQFHNQHKVLRKKRIKFN